MVVTQPTKYMEECGECDGTGIILGLNDNDQDTKLKCPGCRGRKYVYTTHGREMMHLIEMTIIRMLEGEELKILDGNGEVIVTTHTKPKGKRQKSTKQ